MITQQEQNDIAKNEIYKQLAQSYHWADTRAENISYAAERIESILQLCIDHMGPESGSSLIVGALFAAMADARSIGIAIAEDTIGPSTSTQP